MYYYLKGRIVCVFDTSIVIDVNGVGYEVLVIDSTSFEINDELIIYIVHILREDEEFFVGFKSLEEKDLFNKLISCKGVGPKTALSALRGISINDFISAIENEDVIRLKKLDGIGQKAASQIILDLKGSLTNFSVNKVEQKNIVRNRNKDDAIIGLKNLGFKQKEIEKCLNSISDETLSTEEYITSVLRMMRK